MSEVVYSVYCSGSIQKGSGDEKKLCWTDVERDQVRTGSSADIVFLNPDDPITDATNTLGQFGRDMYQIMVASAVVVDARERRGIGIGVEIAAAAAFGTPLITVAAPNSQYRMEVLLYRGVEVVNYVHPHVASLSSAIVDDFTAAGAAVTNYGINVSRRGSVPRWLEPAITEYERRVLPMDTPMLAALRRLPHAVVVR